MSDVRQYAVEVDKLTVKFGDFTAVNEVSFQVEPGEIFGFLGANGAGKTTTIRVLCGLLRPTSGNVRVAGADFAGHPRAIKAKVGYMSQRFTLYPDLTIAENLDFTARLRKIPQMQYERQKKWIFNLIQLQLPMQEKVMTLPSGAKQQVSLANALLHDPEIIFLDEPTAGVTPAARARFWSLIRAIASQGKTVFVTTHYMDEAEQCGRIALMRSGSLIALDSPEGLKTKTFPTPLFEFEPHGDIAFQTLSTLQHHEAFVFFEPYGLRFHAAIHSEEAWQKHRAYFEGQFTIRPLKPSLEDVFIRLVEGKN